MPEYLIRIHLDDGTSKHVRVTRDSLEDAWGSANILHMEYESIGVDVQLWTADKDES